MLKLQIFIRRWGAGQFFLNFKGKPSWILPKAFCRQLSPKYYNFMQKIRRCCKSHAAHFNLLFHNNSTNLNGATESLAPYKWCYENQKQISLLTILLIGAANWQHHLLGARDFVAPFVRCYRLCSTYLLVLLKENPLGSAPSIQYYLVLQGFSAPSNTCITFYFFVLQWRQKVFKRIQDGVSLKIKNNVLHHNPKEMPII